ncbi:hypothetical protein [Bacillus methanolicus]|nr:hypothetical protein [Bacillus methanolicus]
MREEVLLLQQIFLPLETNYSTSAQSKNAAITNPGPNAVSPSCAP